MRVVADTNVVVSGLLWTGPSRQILDRARAGRLDLFTGPILLAELDEVLTRKKFIPRLELARIEPRELVLEYSALARIVHPSGIPPVIDQDPDDDAVLACAVAARAAIIVSGDRHLLNLAVFHGIRILRAAEVVESA